MKGGDDLVTTRQLATTCTVTAVVAVLMGWGLMRADVWKLSSDIQSLSFQVAKLSNDVREMRVIQANNQVVTIGQPDQEKLIREGRDKIIQEWTNAIVRGNQRGSGGSGDSNPHAAVDIRHDTGAGDYRTERSDDGVGESSGSSAATGGATDGEVPASTAVLTSEGQDP